jgi:hypothetical protein
MPLQKANEVAILSLISLESSSGLFKALTFAIEVDSIENCLFCLYCGSSLNIVEYTIREVIANVPTDKCLEVPKNK